MKAEELAEWMHDQYEEIAKVKGWNTQKSTKVGFNDLPIANKITMIEIANRVNKLFKQQIKNLEDDNDDYSRWVEEQKKEIKVEVDNNDKLSAIIVEQDKQIKKLEESNSERQLKIERLEDEIKQSLKI